MPHTRFSSPATAAQRLLAALAVVAVLALDLAIHRAATLHQVVWPDVAAILLMGWLLAQCGVTAVWLVVGRINIAVRTAVGVALLAASALIARDILLLPFSLAAALLVTIYAVTTALCAAHRLWNPASRDAGPAATRWQFSTAQLLGCATAAALACGTLRHVQMPWDKLPSMIAFASVATIATLLPALLLASRRNHVYGWLAAVAVCPLLAIPAIWTGCPPKQAAALAMMFLAQAAVTSFVLRVGAEISTVVRRSGRAC